jgi:hypothetical protein
MLLLTVLNFQVASASGDDLKTNDEDGCNEDSWSTGTDDDEEWSSDEF